MKSAADEEFTAYVAASAVRLRRMAYLLCGDWQRAEEELQTALGPSWPRLPRCRWKTGWPSARRWPRCRGGSGRCWCSGTTRTATSPRPPGSSAAARARSRARRPDGWPGSANYSRQRTGPLPSPNDRNRKWPRSRPTLNDLVASGEPPLGFWPADVISTAHRSRRRRRGGALAIVGAVGAVAAVTAFLILGGQAAHPAGTRTEAVSLTALTKTAASRPADARAVSGSARGDGLGAAQVIAATEAAVGARLVSVQAGILPGSGELDLGAAVC